MGHGRPPKHLPGLRDFQKKHGKPLGVLLDQISINIAESYKVDLDTLVAILTDWEICKGTSVFYPCEKCGNDVTGTLVTEMQYGEA